MAVVLGIGAFLLMFALGEGLRIPATMPAAPYVHGAIFVVGMGGFFALCTYLLSRGAARAQQATRPILVALNAPLIASVLIALAVEPNKGAVLQVAGVAALGIVCSWGGAALGTRAGRP